MSIAKSVIPFAHEAEHLWEFLLPEDDNSGVPFPQDHHEQCFAFIRGISGGLTRYPEVYGEWEHEGHIYPETNIPVRFTATSGDAKRVAV